ncbi:MAG TPA: hypothetical protein PLS51_07135 [Flavobacterium sp.]|jgi:hypothetical protein|nr:hypothetical protein [Flavobacterium sp.]HPJ10387.1 hypothetical protein [Flavobacterium sp.]
MKTIRYFFFVALGSVLMAADCSNKDSEFYNDVYLVAPDLISIETLPSYTVGDKLFLDSDNFSQYLNEPGQATPLDVYATTGGADRFDFTYMLEKKAEDGSWGLVTLGPNLDKSAGITIETDLFVQGFCLYNPLTQHYDFRNGLTLASAGEYRLSFGYNSTSATSVELRSNSVNNNLFLNIDSPNPDLNSSGYYLFTVTE